MSNREIFWALGSLITARSAKVVALSTSPARVNPAPRRRAERMVSSSDSASNHFRIMAASLGTRNRTSTSLDAVGVGSVLYKRPSPTEPWKEWDVGAGEGGARVTFDA